jgi:ATP-binding cassette subfamily B (MDR/TAP) protein 1
VNYLRDHIAVVSQHPTLFDTSVADNISYGRSNTTVEEIVASARAAQAHDFILTLPHGYSTNLGENASLISGGQAQRLQIARALVRPSEILVLDEATSALDPANQASIMETIASVKQGRTTIIVTHKLEMMKMCDRLLVVQNGGVVEQGTYEELIRVCRLSHLRDIRRWLICFFSPCVRRDVAYLPSWPVVANGGREHILVLLASFSLHLELALSI